MQKIPAFNTSRTAAALMAVAAFMPVVMVHAGETPVPNASSAPSGPAATTLTGGLAAREAVRRQQAVAEAEQLLNEGRTAYAAADYEKAVAKYKQALATLPEAPILEERRAVIKQHLANGSVALAGSYRTIGKFAEAKSLLDNVLSPEVDPNNSLAKDELEKLNDPIRTNPGLTAEHTENVEAVTRKLYLGEGNYNLGKFDDAKREFEAVLRIDPYNKAARRWMERVAATKSDYYKSAYDQARSELLMEVDKAWELTIPADAPSEKGGLLVDQGVTSGSALITEKLRTITIPVIDFDDTSVEEAVDFLRQRSVELDNTTNDPANKGINFVVRKPRAVEAAAPAAGGLEAAPAAGAGLGMPEPGSLRIKELRLRNVPISTALKYICDQTRLKFKVDDFAVTLVPSSEGDEDIVTRTFQVPPDILTSLGDGEGAAATKTSEDPFNPSGGNSGGVEGLKPRASVQELLKSKGIPFPEKASAQFIPGNSTLVVRNTPTNMDLIEQIINAIMTAKPKQIKILTKFVEISQENSDELGFDWIVSPFGLGSDLFGGGGTVGSGTPRTNSDFITPVDGVPIQGIPTLNGQNTTNLVTGSNRSGSYAITRDSIDSLLNNPNRTAQNSSVAPGIMSLTGLFSDGQVQMIMRGLSQKKGADVMTAPSIMARSGQKATIEIIREFIYPTEYEPPQLPNSVGTSGGTSLVGGGTQGGSFPVTPATPTAFEPRNTGVTLEIEPTLGANDSVIDLRFAPEITEFEGFINYGSPIESPGSDALGNPTTVTITENRIEMPVFSVRRVSTSLSIYDGHTVAVGGLMKEDVQNVEDKVPILGDLPVIGRLFQSKAENRIKSNLIIFVTAQIIDATGRVLKDTTAPAGATTPSSDAAQGLLPAIQ